MEMTSNCDVTNSAHQKQITTIWPWTKPPPWKFSAYATVNDCKPNPCQNGATCKDSLADYICLCSIGYTGKDCSVGKKYITWNFVFLLRWANNLNFSWVYAKMCPGVTYPGWTFHRWFTWIRGRGLDINTIFMRFNGSFSAPYPIVEHISHSLITRLCIINDNIWCWFRCWISSWR